VDFLERKVLDKIPSVKKEIEKQTNDMMADIETNLRPYDGRYDKFTEFPKEGVSREKITSWMKEMMDEESQRWNGGFCSGTVYHGYPEHIEFMNEIYSITSQTNPLHSDLFPSIAKFEAEIISMTANMLGAKNCPDNVCGSVTSGGSESIMMAMKSYRDRARKERGITKPEMVIPITAHVAFNKAAEYFNIKVRTIPMDENYQVDVKKLEKAINVNTIVIVGSAPTFPQGAIDPIPELSRIAKKYNIGLHVDSCLGGFILPWVKKLGYDMPDFDFSLSGVTSISADTHKYGFAAKGTSVILYRDENLRSYQYFTYTEWPGGIYFSPTMTGSRPGALSAACWASLVSIGEQGFMDIAKNIMNTADTIKKGIAEIPELKILGKPYYNISFTSDEFNIFEILDIMGEKKWNLNGLIRPDCVHICLTNAHTKPGVAERFVSDLKEAVVIAKNNPSKKEGGMAPIYGLASTMPLRGTVSQLLKKYMDALYKV
ncbi:MAG TPA: aminotransferase class V-fold PLP-dependent enzyme, partial [Bacteroidetes bacterium]|nr:aminotransferase class V-fold PLP-dependent enzyme [Bacteroidota bacterium]